MNIDLKKIQIEEAVKRMKKLNLDEKIINDFKLDENIYCSYEKGSAIVLASEDILDLLDIMSKTNKAILFHIIESKMEYGLCYNLLYVSEYQEDWNEENTLLDKGYIYSYVINMNYPKNIDFGLIKVKSINGRLIRIR